MYVRNVENWKYPNKYPQLYFCGLWKSSKVKRTLVLQTGHSCFGIVFSTLKALAKDSWILGNPLDVELTLVELSEFFLISVLLLGSSIGVWSVKSIEKIMVQLSWIRVFKGSDSKWNIYVTARDIKGKDNGRKINTPYVEKVMRGKVWTLFVWTNQ